MKKIGIKLLRELSYEEFESFQYLLDYDFEYENIEENVRTNSIIELDIEDDDEEDRVEDIEALTALLRGFDMSKVGYELYMLDEAWQKVELPQVV